MPSSVSSNPPPATLSSLLYTLSRMRGTPLSTSGVSPPVSPAFSVPCPLQRTSPPHHHRHRPRPLNRVTASHQWPHTPPRRRLLPIIRRRHAPDCGRRPGLQGRCDLPPRTLLTGTLVGYMQAHKLVLLAHLVNESGTQGRGSHWCRVSSHWLRIVTDMNLAPDTSLHSLCYVSPLDWPGLRTYRL